MNPITARSEIIYPPDSFSLTLGKTPVQWARISLKSLALISGIGAALAAVKGEGDGKFLAIPLLISAGGELYWSSTLKDYKNPEELRAMREEAQRLPFSVVEQKHGLENTVKYTVLPRSLLQQKFLEEHQARPLSAIVAQYPFETIWKYALAEPSALREFLLRDLGDLDVSKMDIDFMQTCRDERVLQSEEYNILVSFNKECKRLDQKREDAYQDADLSYPRRQSKLLADLKKQEEEIPKDANKIQQQFIEDGRRAASEQANVRLIWDAVLTDKKASTLLWENLDNNAQGCSVTQQAAEKTAKAWLKEERQKIAARRSMIVEQGLGVPDDRSYCIAIRVADGEFAAALAPLQTSFQQAVRSFLCPEMRR